MIVIETSVPEIKIEMSSGGSHVMVNIFTHDRSEVTPYNGICTMPMPQPEWRNYSKDARWVWASEYWEGVMPTGTLMVMHEPV